MFLCCSAYIMNGLRNALPRGVLNHVEAISRLQELHVDVMPESEDLVCELDIEGTACSVYVDLCVSY